MSITADWIKIPAPNFMDRCITAMRRWPREQKSNPEVNSRDVIEWMSEALCAPISDSHDMKIQDGGCRYLGFRENVNNSGLDKNICTKFYSKWKSEAETGNQFAWRHQMKVRSIRASISVTITYLNQIWYAAQIPQYKQAGMVKFI